MSSQAIHDYLTKEITIERNIVTYRSLSRVMKIHVNVAKNELAKYHILPSFESQASKTAATYLLSGETLAPHVSNDEDDDVDMCDEDGVSEDSDSDGDGDEVARTRLMLVNERDLEVAKTQFMHLLSIHVYSLAPSPIRDAGLLCSLADDIRSIDGQQGSTIASVVGKVVGRNIEVKTVLIKGKAPVQSIAGPSKPKIGTAAIRVTKTAEKPTIKDAMGQEDVAGDAKTRGIEKPSGRLEFSKAKAKEPRNFEPRKPPFDQGKTVIEESKEKFSSKSSLKPSTAIAGQKRKSPMMSGSDNESGPSRSKLVKKPSAIGRVKKRTILSDSEDQDDTPVLARRPRKGPRALELVNSDAEDEVRALMDIDDDQVERMTQHSPLVTTEQDGREEEEEVYQDVEMSDSVIPKTKPRKRREKKIIPMGTNGLKKKRVVKSRMTTDAKGYM
ncbi:DNA polymerase subunit Cdc27, partial [Collybia nuda]